jgi:hypothetical protein
MRSISITTWAISPKTTAVTIQPYVDGAPDPKGPRIYSRASHASIARLAMTVYQHQIEGSATVRPCLAERMVGWHAEVNR